MPPTSNSKVDSILRGGNGGDRNHLISGGPARSRHSNHLDHNTGMNNGGNMNSSFTRNPMVLNPYMMDNGSLYAMQAQASMGGFHHQGQQFAGNPQQGSMPGSIQGNMDFQQQAQQAAMYHMMSSGVTNSSPQNPHAYFNGLPGAMPFANGPSGGIPNFDEPIGNAQGQHNSTNDGGQESDASPPPKPPKKKDAKKKRKKKPKDCPRRPLSGYNLFFKDERKRILAEIPTSEQDKKAKDPKDEITWPGKKRPPHGKIGFESLAKTIGARWKSIDPERLKHYKDLATQDLHRYAREMKAYEAKLSSGQIKEPSDDEDEDSEEEVKPVRTKKKASKSKKRSLTEKQETFQDPNKKARSIDPFSYHQQLQQNIGDGLSQFPIGLSGGNNINFGPSEQEQLFHFQKLQQSMFGNASFIDGNSNSFFGETNESSNQGLPSLNMNGSVSEFEPPSK